jgi:hypothetical protein
MTEKPKKARRSSWRRRYLQRFPTVEHPKITKDLVPKVPEKSPLVHPTIYHYQEGKKELNMTSNDLSISILVPGKDTNTTVRNQFTTDNNFTMSHPFTVAETIVPGTKKIRTIAPQIRNTRSGIYVQISVLLTRSKGIVIGRTTNRLERAVLRIAPPTLLVNVVQWIT